MEKPIYVQITVSTGDKINLELFYDKAPLSVENFVKLAQDDYYVGTIFHRIIPDFMIQTGGYYVEDNTLMEKDKAQAIKGEFSSNGWTQNDITHELGVISMARTSDPNSATSQFFICSATCPWLDGDYAAFGKTTDDASNDVVVKLSNVPTGNLGGGFANFPYELITIEKVEVSNNKFE